MQGGSGLSLLSTARCSCEERSRSGVPTVRPFTAAAGPPSAVADTQPTNPSATVATLRWTGATTSESQLRPADERTQDVSTLTFLSAEYSEDDLRALPNSTYKVAPSGSRARNLSSGCFASARLRILCEAVPKVTEAIWHPFGTFGTPLVSTFGRTTCPPQFYTTHEGIVHHPTRVCIRESMRQ